MSIQLKGLYTALITPFDKNHQLDEKGLRQLIRDQIAAEVDGVVLLGTTGEDPTLTKEEQEMILKIGSEEIKGKTHFLVGTGSYSTAQTIEKTLKAKSYGADAALIITPFYNKPTQEGLYLHYKEIAEKTKLPLCVYNCMPRTSLNLHTETLKRLADIEHIIAVKEASGQVGQMSDVIEKVSLKHPGFTVLSGDDNLTLPLLSLGGHGVISVASNIIPKTMKKLVYAGLNGDMKTLRELHYLLSPLFRGSFIETNPIPIKTLMQMAGKPSGPCRLPLCSVKPENIGVLKEVLQSIKNYS